MFTTSRRSRRVAASVALLATSALALGLAAPASGDTTTDNPWEASSPKTGALNITKYRNTGTGSENSEDPIEGVGYKLQRAIAWDHDNEAATEIVSLDLTQAAGWANAEAFIEATLLETFSSESVTYDTAVNSSGELKTDENGKLSFTDLPIGIYLVTEETYPPDVTPGDPFFVNIPMWNSGDGAWLYTIDIFPKNNVSSDGEKTAVDANVTDGAMGWRISYDIPSYKVTSYVITDERDSELTWVDGSESVSVGGVTLTNTTDNTYFTLTDVANVVTITFEPKGLEVINAAKGEQVVFEYETTVTDVGTHTNKAYVTINGVASEKMEDETKWGQIRLTKLEEGNESRENPLAGAEFDIYATSSPTTQPTNTDTPIGTLRPSTEGVYVSDHLRATRWANGDSAPVGETTWYYWVVETKAPGGYVLPEFSPILVGTVSDGLTDVVVELDVTNKAVDSFTLPATGGMGTRILTIGGVLVLAAAVVLVVRSRRQTN